MTIGHKERQTMNHDKDNDKIADIFATMMGMSMRVVDEYKDNEPMFKAFIVSTIASYYDQDYKKVRDFINDMFKDSYSIEETEKIFNKFFNNSNYGPDDLNEDLSRHFNGR